MGWRPRASAAWAAVLVGIGFVAAEAILLRASLGDDEGSYWQSLRALARGEPLFSSVFASQPPGFYYAFLPFYRFAHSLTGLRVGVLLFGLVGLAATYVVSRLLAGDLAGLLALVLAATSPVYLHQSVVLQADGPAVALSTVAIALALAAVRADGRVRELLAAGAGLTLALAVGIKLLGAVSLVPIALVLLGATRGRGRLVAAAIAGGLLGSFVILLPALASLGAAVDQLVLMHLRAGAAEKGGLDGNLGFLLVQRELPLEVLAALGALVALLRRDRTIVMPLAWVLASVLAVLLYQPLFPHHLVMLSPALAMTAAVGLGNLGELGRGALVAAAALVLVTAATGAAVAVSEARVALRPDLHDAEMVAAIRAASGPGDFWISDNAYAVAAADRDMPGSLVDTSGQRTEAVLLTVGDLEAARVRYDVRWVLVDGPRLDRVPGFRGWLDAHFHAVESLGGGAVVYQH
ncbi:MAG TPA: glycosyltransferase family 39 protein [Candidatus Dormibacteraeota bacterium]|nr:glycosyltransferase family 39 protein [Candidatus Dormibacteraeota bacterium]